MIPKSTVSDQYGFRSVAGYCPMGCGQTLMLGEGGLVTCSLLACSDPTAVATLLDDGETEHVVKFERSTFTVRHPLRERLGDQLMDCELHNEIAAMDGPPVVTGRYRAVRRGARWDFFRLSGLDR